MHWGPLKSAEKPCPWGSWGSRGRRPENRSGRSGGGEHALGHVHGPWGSMGWSGTMSQWGQERWEGRSKPSGQGCIGAL